MTSKLQFKASASYALSSEQFHFIYTFQCMFCVRFRLQLGVNTANTLNARLSQALQTGTTRTTWSNIFTQPNFLVGV